jgi:hypothetical protein
VSRDPHPVYALRIGKDRDGSKMGVLAYAQEHAREWVPPLVTIETAERLLRNYATDGRDQAARQQPRHLDRAVDEPRRRSLLVLRLRSQRKNMTNHCPRTGSADVLGPQQLGRRQQPQLRRVQPLRRLQRCEHELHKRHLRGPG